MDSCFYIQPSGFYPGFKLEFVGEGGREEGGAITNNKAVGGGCVQSTKIK